MSSPRSGLRGLLLKAALWLLQFEGGKAFFDDLACRSLEGSDPQKAGQLIAQRVTDRDLFRHFRATFTELLEMAPEQFVLQLADDLVSKKNEVVATELVKRDPELVERGLKTVSPYALRQECYAQEGEDLVLARVFANKLDGFYVDVGAHHPIRFSNTYLLFRVGWRGINIDATPNSMEEFQRERPNDINIECLVSSGTTSEVFHLFSEPALNTASAEVARQRAEEDPRYAVSATVLRNPRTLSSILDEHLPPGRQIDFLNVDAEGGDLGVLRSNNWDKYRPTFIAVELLPAMLNKADHHPIAQFLSKKGYFLVSRFYNTAFFRITD